MTSSSSTVLLEAQAVSKSIHNGHLSLAILNEINLQIYAGETVAILGVSGSGKSTLLGLLAGLDTPTTGRVLMDGCSITALTEDERAKWRMGRVGFVFQSFHLLPSLTALENVMLPLELVNAKAASSQARQWLDKVGLSERVDHYPNQLSGGEQQRVAIARAFVTQPQLLFADEPTGNLDAQTGATIIHELHQFNQNQKATLILVTHDEKLANQCQRQFLLKEGRLQCIASN